MLKLLILAKDYRNLISTLWCQCHSPAPITYFLSGYTVWIYSWVVLVVLCSQTFVRMCTCIGTYVHIHLTSHVLCHLLCMQICATVWPKMHVPQSLFWSATLDRMCTCISTCTYAHLTPSIYSIHFG